MRCLSSLQYGPVGLFRCGTLRSVFQILELNQNYFVLLFRRLAARDLLLELFGSVFEGLDLLHGRTYNGTKRTGLPHHSSLRRKTGLYTVMTWSLKKNDRTRTFPLDGSIKWGKLL